LAGTMKLLRNMLTAVAALCVLTLSAWASDFQKNDNRQRPPDKETKEIPKGEKPPPPPPRNDNRGNNNDGGKKPRP
jgi:hypothetical protein